MTGHLRQRAEGPRLDLLSVAFLFWACIVVAVGLVMMSHGAAWIWLAVAGGVLGFTSILNLRHR